jgi:hypothetical protein
MQEEGPSCNREMHAEAFSKFQNFLDHQKEILNIYTFDHLYHELFFINRLE